MSSRSILFHSGCFDGAVSCLLAWDFLDPSGQAAEVALRPVQYDEKRTWLSSRLSPNTVVVDFLFHPDADLWADHHATTFLTAEMKETFQHRRKVGWIYDPTAKSCAGLLYAWLRRERNHRNPHFEAAVSWAERIDSADYDTVSDAVFPTQAAAVISQSFAVRHEPEYSSMIVNLLRDSQGDLDAVASHREVRKAIDEARQRTQKGIERLRLVAQQNEDHVVTFDINEDDALISRYSPYVVAPNARYSVGIVRHGTDTKITTMRNPWLHFSSLNLGKLCERFGGGGHERVASIVLRGPDARRTQEIVQQLVGTIHSESPAH